MNVIDADHDGILDNVDNCPATANADQADLDHDGVGDVPHRPVRLFSLLVERNEPTLILLRTPVVKVLDAAERVLPSLTPEMLADPTPLMRRPR